MNPSPNQNEKGTAVKVMRDHVVEGEGRLARPQQWILRTIQSQTCKPINRELTHLPQ